ncbi:MAG: ABC transporter ATP-binding protein [Planctomycetes bacterium]|nr:ABC transporter ATP-binding protein [Planctomycetota bacterium]
MREDPALAVTGLEKRYRATPVVAALDFTLERGEILGLIGPNGAGKTTTLRMLTGFVAPTRGRIEVLGRDRRTEGLAANRQIGYLPENAPLYAELRVGEYLYLRARLKGLDRRAGRTRVAAVLDALDLAPAARRLIGQLSKGYRQRVGLAAAILHEPAVLILDEPTIGLDPTQSRQFRELVLALKGRHSILISSHILIEIEKACDRVLLLHRGRRLALAAPARLLELEGSVGSVVLEAAGAPEATHAALSGLVGLGEIRREETGDPAWSRFVVRTAGAPAPLESIGRALCAAGIPVRELRSEGMDLETIYHRRLEEEAAGP